MNIERTADLAQRASTYAALADITRLQIMDMLSVSDLTASEVGATLNVPSNLLAHHLNVLDAAGLISRHRSEGDRRRHYLTLTRERDDTDHSGHAAPGRAPRITTPQRVLFVCTANTARSHLAAALWRKTSRIAAASAGTHPGTEINPRARVAAERHGITLPNTKPRALDLQRRSGDLLITVCDRAHEEVGGDLHWSVPDPVPAGTDAAFDRALDELDRRVCALVPRLRAS